MGHYENAYRINGAYPLLPQLLGHDILLDKPDVTIMNIYTKRQALRRACGLTGREADAILGHLPFRYVLMGKYRLGELAAIKLANGDRFLGAHTEFKIRHMLAHKLPGKMSWEIFSQRRKERRATQDESDHHAVLRYVKGTRITPDVIAGNFDAADFRDLAPNDWEDLVMRFCTPDTRQNFVEWRD
jgi:hypothetical protein